MINRGSIHPVLLLLALVVCVGHVPPAYTQTPIRIGDGTVQAPRKTKDVKPVLPDGVAPASEQGARRLYWVDVEITIGADGKVSTARAIPVTGAARAAAVPELEAPALAAVRQWEYEPTRLNGVAVPVTMVVQVAFDELNTTPAMRARSARARARGPLRYTYTDLTMARGYDRETEIVDPVTALAETLEREGYRCLTTYRVRRDEVVEHVHRGPAETFVVHCSGGCEGLTYDVGGRDGVVRHLGTSRGYPMVLADAATFMRDTIRWQFHQADPTKVADVRVHLFSKAAGTYGPACQFR